MLECNNLTKIHKNKTVVNGLSFRVKEGEVFALLGSNGAGKTTAIKIILCLIKANNGTVHIRDGVKIGYSPDTPYFPPFLTGYETLEYYAAVSKIPKSQRKAEITSLLELVGLSNDKVKVKNYSKGMTQRLAFAQALLGSPDLLILDEPTAGLDALGRIEIIKLIGNLKNSGKTVILNSHILSDIEQICDRGIIMNRGNQLGIWEKDNVNSHQNLQDYFVELIGGAEE